MGLVASETFVLDVGGHGGGGFIDVFCALWAAMGLVASGMYKSDVGGHWAGGFRLIFM